MSSLESFLYVCWQHFSAMAIENAPKDLGFWSYALLVCAVYGLVFEKDNRLFFKPKKPKKYKVQPLTMSEMLHVQIAMIKATNFNKVRLYRNIHRTKYN